MKAVPPHLASEKSSRLTVQLVDTPAAAAVLQWLHTHDADAVEEDVGPYRNVTLTLSEALVPVLIKEPAVVVIERRGQWVLTGEREAIGNTTFGSYTYSAPTTITDSTLPFQYVFAQSTYYALISPRKSGIANAPDYRQWLSNNYALDTSQYKIAIYDTGLDKGSAQPIHPDILRSSLEWQLPQGYESDSGADTHNHGTMVAGVALGDPATATDLTLSPADALQQRFFFGMGVAPKTGLIIQKALVAGAWRDPISTWLGRAKNAGASVLTSSRNEYKDSGWGTYNTVDQAYDQAVLDHNLPITQAAGNRYPPSWTCDWGVGCASATTTVVLSPGLAKNVITLGGTEGYRPSGSTLNCTDPIPPAWRDARSFNDVAYLSRRGASGTDYRIKPEFVAPATLITSTKTRQRTTQVWCLESGMAGNNLYETASGTSFAAPQAAAAIVLMNKRKGYSPTNPISASGAKAMLAGTATSLFQSGFDRGTQQWIGPRPDRVTGQGFGRIRFAGLIDAGWNDQFYDKLTITGTGSVHTSSYTKPCSTCKTIVVLAWNDVIATANTGNLQTDLDLEVVAGGQSYRGNAIGAEVSYPSGTSDRLNNLEMVILPHDGSVPTFTVNVRGFRVPTTTKYSLYVVYGW